MVFPRLVKIDPCAVAKLLDVLEGINFGCKLNFVFHSVWECLFFLIPLLSLLKSQFRGLEIESLYFLHFLREVGLSRYLI